MPNEVGEHVFTVSDIPNLVSLMLENRGITWVYFPFIIQQMFKKIYLNPGQLVRLLLKKLIVSFT